MVLRTTRRGRPAQASHVDASGREREFRRAQELLRADGVRLVTFAGPAGVGKSWLARELTALLESSRGARVARVHIAGARTYDDLLVSVADAIGLRPEAGDLEDRLGATLAFEPHTVVVDGCDRLAGRPHPVALLLDLVPRVRVVATALSPLHLPGERVIGLDPLAVPPVTAHVDELRRSAAVRLFCRRAAEADHDFDPDRADLAAVAELCRRVHGLPLGIEIMASRVVAESPGATVEYLDSGHEVTLAHTRYVDDQHHLSIRAALEWSYAMLEPRVQQLLRRMAVFTGPASADVLACAMNLGEPDLHVSYSEVLDTVSDLVDRRLAEPHDGPGEPAFVLAALLRDFALEHLVDAGELGLAEEAHTRAVMDLALARSDAIELIHEDTTHEELARSEADLRTCVRRLVGGADVAAALTLATALAPFVLRRGYDGFVMAALDSLLRRTREGDVDDDLLARALMWRARLTVQFDGPTFAERVKADLVRAVDLARRGGQRDTLLLCLSFVMQALPVTGDFDAAADAAGEGLPLAEASGDARWVARFCAWAGMVANQTGEVEVALALAERGIKHVESCRDPRAEVLLALLLSGLPSDRAGALLARLPGVDQLIERSQRLEPRYEPFVLRMAAGLALSEGDLSTAAARCADCLRLVQRQASWHDLPHAVLLLALVATARGDLADAARLHGTVSSQLDTLRPGMPPSLFDHYVRTVEATRVQLGTERFDAFAEQGAEARRRDALAGPLSYAVSAAGLSQVDPEVPAQRRSSEQERLTPRERDVLVELITGATNKEISHRLGVAPKTVMHHSVAIYRKIGVRGRAEATAWAFRNGLVR